MRKKITTIILALATLFMLSSCATVQAQDEMYDVPTPNVTVSVILGHGTPFYIDGLVAYYIYNGIYYYPIYRNGVLYGMHWYRTPLPTHRMRELYRPMPRDYVHKPNPMFSDRPHRGMNRPNARPNVNQPRPNVGGTARPNVNQQTRPNIQQQKPTDGAKQMPTQRVRPNANGNFSPNRSSTARTQPMPRQGTTNSHGNFGGNRQLPSRK